MRSNLKNTKQMKQLIQRLLFGYRPNRDAYFPRGGAKLTYKGGNAEAIHSALVLMKYQLQNGKA